MKNLVVIGIGGSYLSLEFVYEALRYHPDAIKTIENRKLRFLANVDPIDVARALDGLNPEETLFIINSKSFTTAETMLNARTCRAWVLKHYKNDDELKVISRHFCASTCNLKASQEFGIQKENVFEFWDWVGGRFSCTSTIGLLPLSLYFGFPLMETFLKGCNSMDHMFFNQKALTKNIPLMVGLIGWYNISIEAY